MSDVTAVKEALERIEGGLSNPIRQEVLEASEVRIALDAALSYVRMVEEGPDYEEATRFVREVLQIPSSWFTTGDIHQIVDAALADYLTEEE